MARSAWRLEAQNNPILVDTGLLMVATSDESSLILLKEAVLEIPVEYPADSDSAHAGYVWYYLIDVVGYKILHVLVHLFRPSIISGKLQGSSSREC